MCAKSGHFCKIWIDLRNTNTHILHVLLYPSKDDHLPVRKRPAHCSPVEVGNRSVILFLTVCSCRKKQVFATRDAFQRLIFAWGRADAWVVGRFVVMPDHIHLFCGQATGRLGVRSWVKFWKSLVSRDWHCPEDKPLWQTDVWDTQIRTGNQYDEKWLYIRENPVRRGLVKVADDWPHQGQLRPLPWHDP